MPSVLAESVFLLGMASPGTLSLSTAVLLLLLYVVEVCCSGSSMAVCLYPWGTTKTQPQAVMVQSTYLPVPVSYFEEMPCHPIAFPSHKTTQQTQLLYLEEPRCHRHMFNVLRRVRETKGSWDVVVDEVQGVQASKDRNSGRNKQLQINQGTADYFKIQFTY